MSITKNISKLSQYEDDTSLILDSSDSSLFYALDTLELFSKIPGLLFNSSKTKICLAQKKFLLKSFITLDWGAKKFVLLEIPF